VFSLENKIVFVANQIVLYMYTHISCSKTFDGYTVPSWPPVIKQI